MARPHTRSPPARLINYKYMVSWLRRCAINVLRLGHVLSADAVRRWSKYSRWIRQSDVFAVLQNRYLAIGVLSLSLCVCVLWLKRGAMLRPRAHAREKDLSRDLFITSRFVEVFMRDYFCSIASTMPWLSLFLSTLSPDTLIYQS